VLTAELQPKFSSSKTSIFLSLIFFKKFIQKNLIKISDIDEDCQVKSILMLLFFKIYILAKIKIIDIIIYIKIKLCGGKHNENKRYDKKS